jgi:hypothetical protein
MRSLDALLSESGVNFGEILRSLFLFVMMTERILIVENGENVAEPLAHHLRGEGFRKEWLLSGRQSVILSGQSWLVWHRHWLAQIVTGIINT